MATTAVISEDMIRDLIAEAIESRFGFVDHLPDPIEWLSGNGLAYTAHQTRFLPKLWGLMSGQRPSIVQKPMGLGEAFITTFKRDYVHSNPSNDARTVMKRLPK